jgi:hypothetical protein
MIISSQSVAIAESIFYPYWQVRYSLLHETVMANVAVRAISKLPKTAEVTGSNALEFNLITKLNRKSDKPW